MTLRPARFVAVAVLTCTFVLTGCTVGPRLVPGTSAAFSTHTTTVSVGK